MHIETNSRQIEPEEIYFYGVIADLVIDVSELDAGVNSFEILGESLAREDTEEEERNQNADVHEVRS